MKNKSRKLFSALLALVMVFGLLAAVPMTMTVSAANEGALATTIYNFDPGNGAGPFQLTAIADTVNHTVTVTGTVTGATNTLALDIDAGVTVIWNASYSGTTPAVPDTLIKLSGKGTFEVAAGGSIINNGAGLAIYAPAGSDFININVNGGTATATTGYAVYIAGNNATVAVTGGTASATTGGAVAVKGNYASVNVNGGTVSATTGVGIFIEGGYSTVNVSGGAVSTGGAASYAVSVIGDNAIIDLTGGAVTATTGWAVGVIGDNARINMSGAAAVSTTTGFGVGVSGANARVSISGGTVKVSEPLGIAVGINGVNGRIEVSGGVISAADMAALYIDGANAEVTVSGGFVFAYGTAISGTGNVINMVTGGTPKIEGAGIACAWNKGAGNTKYASETLNDMSVAPAGTALWGVNSSNQSGISYASGANTGFFPISLVTVTPTAYKFTFNSNGGTDVAEKTVNSGSKAAKPADPVKDGFVFAGWFTDAEFKTEYDFDSPVKSNFTVYAKWTEAHLPTMANFKKINHYTSGLFADVDENQWYGFKQQKVIANAYEYGLMKGNSAITFNPSGNMTIAEAITVAVRVHNIYNGGDGVFVQGAVWYQVYVDYAVANGIITATTFSDYTKTATRAEMAFIFSSSLPAAEFASQNTVNSLPDVNSGTAYNSAIIMLYKAGVLGGSDAAGTFKPGDNITRAEAAAIISRVILPGERFKNKIFG